MAKGTIPNPLERRHLVERQLPSDQALAIAEAYLADDRRPEAVAFLAKAGAEERLDELTEFAVADGDGFLLSELARVRQREPEPELWARLEESARAAGKLSYAESAQRQTHRSED